MFFKIARAGQHQFWKYLLTIFLVILGYFLGQLPLTAVIFQKFRNPDTGNVDSGAMQTFVENMDFSTIGMSSNVGFLLVLLTFVGGMLGLWFGVTKIHDRTMQSLISPKPRLDWSKLFFSFFFWIGISMVMEVGMYLIEPETYSFHFDAFNFFVLLLICLLVLPIQTSFEELFFRGYLFQGIGLATNTRLVPLILTSVLFGMVHFANPEIDEFGSGLMMGYYISVGLFLAIITLLDDSLELALGVHAAINFYRSAFVTFTGSVLDSDAIGRIAEPNVNMMLVAYGISVVIFFVVCWRKYGWGDWGKVFGPLERPENSSSNDIA